MSEKSPKHGLTRHVRGAWYKSINGEWKLIAGKREAPTADDADRIYQEKFAALWGDNADKAPRKPISDALLKDLFNQFLHAKRLAVAAGKLNKRTFDEYADSLQKFLDLVGKVVTFAQLAPFDFTRVHQQWQLRYGPHRLSKYVSNVRTCFNWLKGNGFIADVPEYGDFRQPVRADFRRHIARQEQEGLNLPEFTPAEIAVLLKHADVQQTAQILLGLNGGFGNTDLSELRERVIDFNGGWIDYRRGKTGVKRRCPMWPETILALKAALPLSKIVGNVFSTSDGRPLVQGSHDRLAARFKTLCEAANCYIDGRGFYKLRDTAATEMVTHGSTLLVKRITGHTSPGEDRILDEHYVGQVDVKLCEMVDASRHHLLSEWSRARLGEPLKAAPSPSRGRRQGKPRSRGAGIGTRGRTAGRGSSS